jgi:hypothetical protein
MARIEVSFDDEDFKLVLDCLQIASNGYRQQTLYVYTQDEVKNLYVKANRVDALRDQMKEVIS